MKKINFSMPVIFVKDIYISKTFYQKLFSLEVEMDFGENIVFKNAFSIWQRARAEKIIFQKDTVYETKGDRNNFELYFETEDIELIWKKVLSIGVEIVHPIKEEQWGQRVFRIYDPDRFIIEIAEPMSRVVKRFNQLGLSEEEISIKTQMGLDLVKKIISNKN